MKKQEEIKILKVFKQYKVPYDLIDYKAIYDDKITFGENIVMITDLIKELASSDNFEEKTKSDFKTKRKGIKQEREEINKVEIENLRKEEKNSYDEFEKSINKIKFKTTNILDNAFKTPKELIRTLTKSENIFGLVLKGGAGIGKSYCVIKGLKDLGLKKGVDFDILTAYTTPLELYQFLYENRENKIILLDDTMGFFDNKINVGIVLAGLWGEGKRIIHYNSSSGKLKVPNNFIFNSKIVWCLNELPKQLEAVKSRCFFYEIKFNYQEKIKLLYEISKIKKMDTKIVDLIKENSDEMTPNLDFRLVYKIYDIQQHNKNWEEIAIKLLNKSPKLVLLKKLISECSSIREAEVKWCKETDMSRKSFFNYKKTIGVKV